MIDDFTLKVPDETLADLRDRLARTRWPDRQLVDDWSQGAPLEKVRELCEYWRTSYDWRRCESMLNGLGQSRTEIDGVDIHFLHIKSPEPDALPLIMTHGWPGSVIEFNKVIGPLTNPTAHGGDRRDAFHLVIPSIPGYGFSGKPTSPGWGADRVAAAWIELMRRLGYDRYGAQGGDWGGAVTAGIGYAKPAACIGIHLNLLFLPPSAAQIEDATETERKYLERIRRFSEAESAYSLQQATYPQTLGYGLADSPVGQAAWIYEKFHGWTDPSVPFEDAYTKDELLDNIMLYWLPNNATSSARIYWESMSDSNFAKSIEIPVGISVFPEEIFNASRRWAEQYYPNINYWNEVEKGGHFAAFEQPAIFVDEIRASFRSLR